MNETIENENNETGAVEPASSPQPEPVRVQSTCGKCGRSESDEVHVWHHKGGADRNRHADGIARHPFAPVVQSAEQPKVDASEPVAPSPAPSLTAERALGLAKMSDLPPLRMDAYYFGFVETGVRAVDEILSAVAVAGKAYHHTDGWSEPRDGTTGSYVDAIQDAASRAASIIRQHEG